MPKNLTNSILEMKKIDLEFIARWIYSLNDLDIKIFLFLLNQCEKCCIKFITEKFQKERSVIQRSLNKLSRFNLIKKIKVTLNEHRKICKNLINEDSVPERGYLYMYQSITLEELKSKLNNDFSYIINIFNSVINNVI